MSDGERKPFSVLITGTGYCGTGWAAELLTRAGMPCGHEAVFKHDRSIVEKNATRPAESSWPAAFSLKHPLLQGTKIIHLMRHPLRVIESWSIAGPDRSYRRIGADNRREKVMYERLAGRYLHIVNLLKGYPSVRIEDGPLPLLRLLKLQPSAPPPPSGINSHRGARAPWLRWASLPDLPNCRELRKWAESNGYGDDR